MQLPLALDDESEPDVTVVRGAPRDFLRDHPSAPALVVEVAEYWIVNLVDRVLEVYRAPTGRGSGRRPAYADVRRMAPPEFVTPLASPAGTIAVADLLP